MTSRSRPSLTTLVLVGVAAVLLAAWPVSRLLAGEPELTATGHVRTTELQDNEATYVVGAGRGTSCAQLERPGNPVVLVTVEWLSPDIPSDATVRLSLAGPRGWSAVGCLPEGTVRTSGSGRGRGTAASPGSRFAAKAGEEGKFVVGYAPAEAGSIPDLEPWSATVWLEHGGRTLGKPVDLDLTQMQQN